MRTKKHPKANLENYSKLFVQLGLVLSLLVVYVLIQNKTFEKNITGIVGENLSENFTPEQNIEYKIEPIKVLPIKKLQVLINIKKEDNNSDIEEDVFKIIDPDGPIKEPIFIEVDPKEGDNFIEDVPFEIIEDVPVYPGCKGDKEQLRACLQEEIKKHINRKFNSGLGSELGLTPGVKKIFVIFKIDKNGDITNVQARAPHKRLQEEAIRVVNLLPKMTPGKQRQIAVGVKYSLPIAFKVE
ncbi:energy transducer TonB [uncultured Lutibacter sp.]|uniref:energy transducer TonB n=1 Tax=uncultured Lutibacter sp. TaxID=437739 RepID=UPI0026083ADF|nr:energy transducer TonB [uncultured Lutibacter sp.]